MIHDSRLIVTNTATGEYGLAVELVPSPFWHEASQGIQRLKVIVKLPPSSGDTFYGWDWWLMSETTIALPVLANDVASAA